MLATAATSCFALVTAAAAAATYVAEFAGQCCYVKLETGDKVESYFDFRNVGTQTWFRGGAVPVRLGTSNPFERVSPFFTQGDWVSRSRPTGLDVPAVPPGQIGRFKWIATAPQKVGLYTEYYAPRAEGTAWLTPGGVTWLKYEVIAAQAPTLRVTAGPVRVKRGDAISVTAEATDNRGIDLVAFSVGAQTVSATTPAQGASGYTATLRSDELAAGTHNVAVRAYDLGGRASSALVPFEVYAPPAPSAPPSPSAPPAPSASTRLGSFTPLFATRTARRQRVGTLHGLGGVVGLRPGTRIRVVCTRRCTRKLNESRKSSTRGRVRLTLKRPLRLLTTTYIELRATLSGYVTRFQRYRFRRSSAGTVSRFVNSGCLATQTPRVVKRCPSR